MTKPVHVDAYELKDLAYSDDKHFSGIQIAALRNRIRAAKEGEYVSFDVIDGPRPGDKYDDRRLANIVEHCLDEWAENCNEIDVCLGDLIRKLRTIQTYYLQDRLALQGDDLQPEKTFSTAHEARQALEWIERLEKVVSDYPKKL